MTWSGRAHMQNVVSSDYCANTSVRELLCGLSSPDAMRALAADFSLPRQISHKPSGL